MVKQYIKELAYLKVYISFILLAIVLGYSSYLIFDEETIGELGKEDHLFEWIGTISLFFSFIICFTLFFQRRNIFFLLLGIVLLFGTGEEISWGQRIFEFETPEEISKKNVQGEFNLHNLNIFNGVELEGNKKKGLERFMEINFLFRLFTMLFGIILPFIVYHIAFIGSITKKIKLPIPPITIGVFFFINWIIFRIVHTYLLPADRGVSYLRPASEIFESVGTFILFIIMIYFYRNRKKVTMGSDIKNSI